MIASILLIPDPKDEHGLLKEGICGARPPMARQLASGRWCSIRHPGAKNGPRALVYKWEGFIVPEGYDRLWRAGAVEPVHLADPGREWPGLNPFLRPDEEKARDVARLLSCRLILLDVDGREVPP